MLNIEELLRRGPLSKSNRIRRFDIAWPANYATHVEDAIDTDDTPVALSGTPQSYVNMILGANPSHYYRLAETTGTDMLDSVASGGIDGLYAQDVGVSAGWLIPGAIYTDPSVAKSLNYATRHAAANDFILGGGAGASSEFTVEFWLLLTTHSSDRDGVMGITGVANSGFELTNQNEQLTFVRWDASVNDSINLGGATLARNKWYHVAFTIDSAKVITAYLNGRSVARKTLRGANPYNNLAGNDLQIGRVNNTEDIPPFGLDHLAFYPRALAGSEIKEHFQRGYVSVGIAVSGTPPSRPQFNPDRSMPTLINEQDITAHVDSYSVNKEARNFITTASLKLKVPWGYAQATQLLQAGTYIIIEQRFTGDGGIDTGWIPIAHLLSSGPIRDARSVGDKSPICAAKGVLSLLTNDTVNYAVQPDIINVPRRTAQNTYQDLDSTVFRMPRLGRPGQFLYDWVDHPRTRIWASGFTTTDDGVSFSNMLPVKSANGSIQIVGGQGEVIFNTNYFRQKFNDEGLANPSKIELSFQRFATFEDLSYVPIASDTSTVKDGDGNPTRATITVRNDGSIFPDDGYVNRSILVKTGLEKGEWLKIINAYPAVGYGLSNAGFPVGSGPVNYVPLQFKGQYDGAVSYVADDVVAWLGHYWRRLNADIGVHGAEPDLNPLLWQDQGAIMGTGTGTQIAPQGNYQGTWDSSTFYRRNDSVLYNGNFYIATVSNRNQNPVSFPFHWDFLIEEGGPNTNANVYQGTWSNLTTYAPYQTVLYSGNYYYTTSSSTNQTPGSGAPWVLIGATHDHTPNAQFLGYYDTAKVYYFRDVISYQGFYYVLESMTSSSNPGSDSNWKQIIGVEGWNYVAPGPYAPPLVSFDVKTVDNLIPDLTLFNFAVDDVLQVTDCNLLEDALWKILWRRGFQQKDPSLPFYVSLAPPVNVEQLEPHKYSFVQNVSDLTMFQEIWEEGPPNYYIVEEPNGSVVARTVTQKATGTYDSDLTGLVGSIATDSSEYGVHTRVIGFGEGTSTYNVGFHKDYGGYAVSGAYKLTDVVDNGTVSQSTMDDFVSQILDPDPTTPTISTSLPAPYNYGVLYQQTIPGIYWTGALSDSPIMWIDLGRNSQTGNTWKIERFDFTSFSSFNSGHVIPQSLMVFGMTEEDYISATGTVPSAVPGDTDATTIAANMEALLDDVGWEAIMDETSMPEGGGALTVTSADFVKGVPAQVRFLKIHCVQPWFRLGDSGSSGTARVILSGFKAFLSQDIVKSAELGVSGEFQAPEWVDKATRLRRRTVTLDKNVSLEDSTAVYTFALNELRELSVEFEPETLGVVGTLADLHDTVFYSDPETGEQKNRIVRSCEFNSASSGERQLTTVDYIGFAVQQ